MADDMMASAAAAYAAATKQMNNLPVNPSSDTQAMGEPGFADLLKEAVREASGIVHKSEQLTVASAMGQADVNEVITAVAEAEVTLSAVTTVRDRVIQAYQEILKMPI